METREGLGQKIRRELLAPVVQTSDSAIHRINHYPADSVIDSVILIRWIVIYPLDSAIQLLNNWGLEYLEKRVRLVQKSREEKERY